MGKVEEVGEELRAAMCTAKTRGYIIARRVTIDPEVPRCCAIGAYAIVHKLVKNQSQVFVAVRGPLGLDGSQLVSIADGFDDKPLDKREGHDLAYYNLGRTLAAEFLK